MATRDEYVRKMHAKLDEMNAEIDRLIARSGEVEEAGRQEFGRRMEDLRQRRDEARARLESLGQSGESAWEDIKAGTELAWQAIAEAIDSARQRFKK